MMGLVLRVEFESGVRTISLLITFRDRGTVYGTHCDIVQHTQDDATRAVLPDQGIRIVHKLAKPVDLHKLHCRSNDTVPSSRLRLTRLSLKRSNRTLLQQPNQLRHRVLNDDLRRAFNKNVELR